MAMSQFMPSCCALTCDKPVLCPEIWDTVVEVIWRHPGRQGYACKDEHGLCEGSAVNCVGKGRLFCSGFLSLLFLLFRLRVTRWRSWRTIALGRGGISCIFARGFENAVLLWKVLDPTRLSSSRYVTGTCYGSRCCVESATRTKGWWEEVGALWNPKIKTGKWRCGSEPTRREKRETDLWKCQCSWDISRALRATRRRHRHYL